LCIPEETEPTRQRARTRNLVAAAVFAAPRLNLFSAMLVSGFAFLLVAATPRTQFLGVILYLAVAGIYMNFERQGRIPAAVLRSG
jgi:hypothetical protein